MESEILRSELAGTWYSDNPEQLAREIDAYLERAKPEEMGKPMALILPHAGYRYSGMVAAHAVKLLQGKSYGRVIVLGPSHRVSMFDTVSIPDVSHIETPLGLIEIDRDFVAELWGNERFQSYPQAHGSEHSVQIELPFLQRVLGHFKLVPIVCGELGMAGAESIARTLRERIDADTLVVVSSDFTHYGRNFDYVPFTNNIPANLKSLDLGAFRLIEQKKLGDFLRYIDNTGATICGRSPIAVLLAMLPDSARVRLLKYETSGDLTGDWSHCVSYISAAVSGAWTKIDKVPAPVAEGGLSESDRRQLLAYARYLISKQLKRNGPDFELAPTPAMKQTMGAFVTLHKQGQLCGCIGEIFPRRALHAAIAEQALNAAFHDPRFPKLREDELNEVDIEISALTAPHSVPSYEDIEIGKHGIVLSKGMCSAVFLPQVAPEQGWGLSTTLSHLAMKAGLGPDDWKSGCQFQVFEAIVFGEKTG
ncbi:AmmeMemoRadiSam system protein B [Pontiella sp.]|uniref:AmmeMemoRadiSam system protein B n=2 Tax=Pontiella sp. TaxID=2837462 RepID=UPI0035657D18